GGVSIGLVGETAVHAGELGLGFPVGLLAMPARGAGPRRVAGVHEDDRHSGQLGLVADEALQLGEGPTRMLRPVLGPNRGPLADVLEVFKPDPAPGVFGQSDQFLGNAVVLVPAVIRLATGQPLEPWLGTLGAGPLIRPAGSVAATSDSLHDIAGVDV